ncbi:bifunctional 3'-5' exonuclease/ATP-dependent helicase WRN [Spea bombifrons]|uniref:bifunctional 3'-5' exonuclease/ATP-dependent helicase WRN n=1 Tax=Spea bombifrons TaxID=233779 RepID=UPI00234A950C|nr:bifunctional 3'-5' exonuclease/ATP-dependent helicase WRN [Spea bombifrons]
MAKEPRNLPQWMSAQEKESANGNKKKLLYKKNILEDDLPFFEFTGSIVYSYEGNDCSLLSEVIRSELPEGAVLGFDIEWPAVYTKGKNGKVALIQVCVSERKCYLFHISAMTSFPKGLKRLLEDESIRKVGVGIEGDQWKLMSDCDLKLKGFIELADVANQKLKCKEKWSLNGLVKHLFKKQLLKDSAVRCSRWDMFPLKEEQKLYAASDAYAGLQIYQKLESMDEQEKTLYHPNKENNFAAFGVKQKISSLSQGLVELEDLVPCDFEHSKDGQRALHIIEDIFGRLEELKSIIQDSKNDNGQLQDGGQESDSPMLHEKCMGPNEGPSRGNKSNESWGKGHEEQDFFSTLGISEEELNMIEQEGVDEQRSKNDYKSDEDMIEADVDTNPSIIIDSDEELESEMLKSVDDLDNSREKCHEIEPLQQAIGKELTVALDEEDEDDEGIEEEEDDWDPSVPEPTLQQISCLKTYFGHSSFKPVQWKVIHSVLKERRDNLVVMATGYGKSLCYQFAPVYTSGIGIVISPLISLMEDQVLQLEMSNIASCFLGSAQSKNVMHDVKAGRFKVIYMTPEFCSSGMSLLQDLHNKYGITLIAIDEAHCISEWGHDFRSAYRNLGSLKRTLKTVPFVALTATASPSIREDIIRSLDLQDPQITCTSFDRPNLFLEVARKTSNISKDLQQFLIKKQGSSWEFEGATIVYCPSRKTSEQVTAELTKLGIKCDTYHAGMGIKARRDVHHRFMRDEIQCVVATVAFGMGINKADIRKVIHYGAPKEMESYYQEIGRAGRDGLPSSCHALWAPADMNFNRHMLSEIKNKSFGEYKLKMLGKMEKYLNSSSCRRKIILSHFEDKQLRKALSGIMGTEKCCDNCRTRLLHNLSINDTEGNLQDFGQKAYQLLSAVEALGGKFGTGVPVLFLRGSNSQRLPDRYRRHPCFGKGKDQTEVFWKALARQLITEGFLQESSGHNKFATTCGLTVKGRNWISKAENELTPSLLLQPNEDLCPRRTFTPSLQTHSPLVRQPSPNARSAKPGPDHRKTLDRFSYKEGEKLPKTSVSKTRLQSPIKPSKPPEPTISPRELELQTSLYGKLVAARQKIASEKDIPPAVLATNKVLVDMAKLRPTTVDNIKKLDGVSEAKATMLAPLVATVMEFCLAHGLQTDALSSSSPKSANTPVKKVSVSISLPESQRVTYSMFQEQHLSMQTIADARSLSIAAVGMHLCQALKAGYPVNVQRTGLTSTIQDTISNVIKKPPINSDLSSFTSIREQVPPSIDSYLIRMAIALLEKEPSKEREGQKALSSTSLPITTEQPKPELMKGTTVTWIDKKKSMETLKSNFQQPAIAQSEPSKAPNVAPIKLASWNQPTLDAETEELFSESQLQSSATTPKRKLPEWFGSRGANSASSNVIKKVKVEKKKGLFG